MSESPDRWIADRMRRIEASGIRKVFELTKTLKDPVNLSIGQPHFDVPESIKAAAKDAIDRGANGYTVTQGIPPLRQKIHETIRQRFPHPDREVVVTSGSSGGLMLALCCTVNRDSLNCCARGLGRLKSLWSSQVCAALSCCVLCGWWVWLCGQAGPFGEPDVGAA